MAGNFPYMVKTTKGVHYFSDFITAMNFRESKQQSRLYSWNTARYEIVY